MKFKGILILFLILCLSISSVCAEDLELNADEINLDASLEISQDIKTDLGESDVANNDFKTFDDLQKLIDEAKSGDTVKLNGTYVSSGNEIAIGKPIILDGGDDKATLDGKSLSRILNIDAKGVILKNIKFINGAGAIIGGHYLSAFNCDFINNTDSAISIGQNGGQMTIVSCSFINNTGFAGGAMQLDNSYVDGCTFINNTATEFGGACYLFESEICNSIFANNAAKSGNDCYISSLSAIYDCTLSDVVGGEFTAFTKMFEYGDKISVSLFDYEGNKVAGKTVSIAVYSPGSFAVYSAKTNSKGVATFNKILASGIYEYEITFKDTGEIIDEGHVEIGKVYVAVKAPKVTAKLKKSKYFKVTLRNENTNKLLKNVKVKVKVYTGKKYKTYTLKTDSKGVAKLNTKSLKKGTHKVVITSGNSNYKFSQKTSSITIKK